MNDNERDLAFVDRIRKGLDAGLERLDPAVEARLRESRRQAILLAEGKQSWFFAVPRWVTASGFATVAVVAVTLSLWSATPRHTLDENTVEEIEILTTQGQLDMYEDLEFYQWLEKSSELKNGS